MLSKLTVALIFSAAIRAETCVPLSQLKHSKNVPIAVPETAYKQQQASYELTIGVAKYICPELQSKIYDNVYFTSVLCGGSTATIEGVKECNPGKPIALCKKSCIAGLRKQIDVLKTVQCDLSSGKKAAEEAWDMSESDCDTLPETNCYEINETSNNSNTTNTLITSNAGKLVASIAGSAILFALS